MTRGLLVLLAAMLLAAPAWALEPINQTFFGTAIKGYDPVAYFTEGKAVKGSRDFEVEWEGATWRFANASHRDLFRDNPERYAPQYGGYCAWAVSQGYTAGIDPHAWNVVADKLYLNYSQKVQQQWLSDRDAHIVAADRNWPTLRDG